MNDETDELLHHFLDVASGERTAQTRARYELALEPLRQNVEHEDAGTPALRLVLRILGCLQSLDSSTTSAAVRETAPSLWGRLLTWLRRNESAGLAGEECAVLEAAARLRDLRERRSRERYAPLRSAYSRYAEAAVSYPSYPPRSDDGLYDDALYDDALYDLDGRRHDSADDLDEVDERARVLDQGVNVVELSPRGAPR